MTTTYAVVGLTVAAVVLGVALGGLIFLFDGCNEEAHSHKLGAGRLPEQEARGRAGPDGTSETTGADILDLCSCDSEFFPDALDADCPVHGLPRIVRAREIAR
jgi:hypothetical protein